MAKTAEVTGEKQWCVLPMGSTPQYMYSSYEEAVAAASHAVSKNGKKYVVFESVTNVQMQMSPVVVDRIL